MKWKQILFSNMFWRNMLADFGGRSGYDRTPGNFTPYFRYKIGVYEPDEYLYFPKEPFPLRYKNEIFNKLFEYNGFDIIKYLDFHFTNYQDKDDFLRFLHYEISERLKLGSGKSRNLKLQSALAWVTEKKATLQQLRERKLSEEIKKGVQEIVTSEPHSSLETDALIQLLADKLSSHIEKIMAEAEEGIRGLTGSFTTGNIQVNNRNHEEKIIQVLILLQQVQAPSHIAKAELVFKRFTAADIAAILHLHFEAFHDNKLNTLQRKVGDQMDRIKTNNLKVKRLTEALQDFFY
ncbi:MAG: hypothetical protein BGO55_01460 [Sphingobacteriales bacterium 50-39]|nr:hypothetical protein [Sphingobacteriales bacterium]OJW53773.1 MAG: hypothetical protein BGO55_01460 [Sphingobacteriales bacterium 50-39]